MSDAVNQQKVVFKIEITAYDDGQILVQGPFDRPMVFFDLMNTAERTVLNRTAKQINEQAEKRIVTPNTNIKLAGIN